ncbi:MAG: hypothetical protein KAQ98_09290, partial [Bacteriovoracaceae bacterium]|nr:hypothetical protein [Bacteriovoracaceae bacterium]
VKFLNQYDIVVMPGGLENPGHGDHANSAYILKNVKSSVELFGYIAIGYTNSFSIEEIKKKIDLWKRMRVDGIFLDEAGFDYWDSDAEMRKRQSEAVNHAHKNGLRVFLNAWNPDDLFVKQSDNPLKVDKNDYALLESYIFSFAGPLDFRDYEKKIRGFRHGKDKFGIQLVGLSTTNKSEKYFRQSDFDFMVHTAQVDGLDGVGWGTANFSATSSRVVYRKIKREYNRLEMSDVPADYNEETGIVSKKLKNGTLYLDYNDFSFEVTP